MVEIVHGAAEVALAFLDRVVAEPELIQARFELGNQFPGVGAGREFERGPIADEAAFAQQAGAGQIGHREINARRDGGEGDGLTGHFLQTADDARGQITQADVVTNLGVELREQTFFHQRAAAPAKLLRRAGGFSLQTAVERKAVLQRTHLHQPGAGGIHEVNHRGKRGLPRLLAADFPEQLFLLRLETLSGSDDEIGSEEAPGLLLDGAFEVAAQRTDGGQRGDAKDDGAGKEEQLAPAGTAVAPGHPPGPVGKEMTQQTAV